MNPKTRRAALHAIAAIAILASLNALAHSYAGLYQWAIHHRMSGWQAFTWPAEIDVFLIIGELALYVAYLDAWTTRHKIWPWATALLGLTVSVAGNIGHLAAVSGAPVSAVDRITAATSPLAAFAGLAIALLVLKQTRPKPPRFSPWNNLPRRAKTVPGSRVDNIRIPMAAIPLRLGADAQRSATDIDGRGPLLAGGGSQLDGEPGIVQDARELLAEYELRGMRLSRRQLAAQLRARGHTLANARIPEIADTIGLAEPSDEARFTKAAQPIGPLSG